MSDLVSVGLTSLGGMAAALVGALSQKVVDQTASMAVNAGDRAGGKLIAWLRAKLGSTRELQLVVDAPDSARAKSRLAEVIDAEVVDSTSITELKALIEEVRQDEADVYQSAIGHHIVQASHSTVNVNWASDGSDHEAG